MSNIKNVDPRNDFPIFSVKSNSNLVYLDSAATTFKPKCVLDVMKEYYEEYSSNIHRGLYPISVKASEEYEQTREVVKSFINSSRKEEVIFTKGATEGLNLLASTLCKIIPHGSEIVVTIMDHHANFVPWQQVAIEKKFKFGVVMFDPLNVTLEMFKQIISNSITSETSVFAFPYVTNVMGVEFPVEELIKIAKAKNPNVLVVIDACQAIQHIKIDVQKLDCDFLVFSGHKIFGPTGVGVCYGKYALLERLSPYQYGGDMIEEVATHETTFAKPPSRFEAGTQPIAEVIGLKAALKYVQSVGQQKIHNHSAKMYEYAIDSLNKKLGEKVELYTPKYLKSSSIISFNLRKCHSHDVSELLANKNICIRAGHHCAQPLHTHLDMLSTCRASFSIYNTFSDIDLFVETLSNIYDLLS